MICLGIEHVWTRSRPEADDGFLLCGRLSTEGLRSRVCAMRARLVTLS